MQCPVCKNEVGAQDAFCKQCGAPISGTIAGAVPAEAGATSSSSYAVQPVAARPGLSENAAAAIAYLTIIPAIVFLVLEPYNKIPLVRFHSWQSIGLGIAAFLLQAIVSIGQVALHSVPGSYLLFGMVHLMVSIGLFVAWLVAILKAGKGEWYKLPVIGDFAERQARG